MKQFLENAFNKIKETSEEITRKKRLLGFLATFGSSVALTSCQEFKPAKSSAEFLHINTEAPRINIETAKKIAYLRDNLKEKGIILQDTLDDGSIESVKFMQSKHDIFLEGKDSNYMDDFGDLDDHDGTIPVLKYKLVDKEGNLLEYQTLDLQSGFYQDASYDTLPKQSTSGAEKVAVARGGLKIDLNEINNNTSSTEDVLVNYFYIDYDALSKNYTYEVKTSPDGTLQAEGEINKNHSEFFVDGLNNLVGKTFFQVKYISSVE